MATLRLALLVGALLPAAAGSVIRHENFNGAHVSYPRKIHLPHSEWQVRRIVKRASAQGHRVRVVGGSGHTWGDLSTSDEGQVVIDMQNFNRVLRVDKRLKQVTVQSGLVVHALVEHLHPLGLALQGMGAIDLQSIGGVIATGTHGSNVNTSTSFSDQVVRLTLMDSNGGTHRLCRGDPHFTAAKTNLGMLGVVLEVTLQLTDQFYIHESTGVMPIANWTLDVIENDLQTYNYSVVYLVFIQTEEQKVIAALQNRVGEPAVPIDLEESYARDEWVGRYQETSIRSMVRDPTRIPEVLEGFFTGMSARAPPVKVSFDALASQAPKGWYPLTTYTDTEYVCPLDKLMVVWAALMDVLGPVQDIGFFIAIRFQASSDSLVAPNAASAGWGGMWAFIDIPFFNKVVDHHIRVKLEARLLTHGARPHWGKVNDVKYSDVVALYGQANVDRFKAAKKAFDSANMFGNAYTDSAFGLN
ncbi:L-gulono-1 [Diplonema papillatum]|nr:L-gulono-1 [Diplonema papillatum]